MARVRQPVSTGRKDRYTMIAVPDPSATAPNSFLIEMDQEAHWRYVARRRWIVQQAQQRERLRGERAAMVDDRVKLIPKLRPGRAVASSLSPVYSMFNDAFLHRR